MTAERGRHEILRELATHGEFEYWAGEVGRWHRSIFGDYDPRDHIRAIAQKAQEEAAELASDPGREELADVLICGLAAADRLEVNPVEIIREKLNILKERGVSQLSRDKDRGIVQAKEMAETVSQGTSDYCAPADDSLWQALTDDGRLRLDQLRLYWSLDTHMEAVEKALAACVRSYKHKPAFQRIMEAE